MSLHAFFHSSILAVAVAASTVAASSSKQTQIWVCLKPRSGFDKPKWGLETNSTFLGSSPPPSKCQPGSSPPPDPPLHPAPSYFLPHHPLLLHLQDLSMFPLLPHLLAQPRGYLLEPQHQ
ncbi:hypothetical protein SLEP1_g2129 [Rubroshorea leprosula]|uniref:Uncharacterized protein n=1 Tax=Rubroshorea leprosula TaxID=152421 RepID=A0AAV5HG56_9ROSI|nr:hypothetical protein SLEP1_g2129 [Rubroshorea leprosula]